MNRTTFEKIVGGVRFVSDNYWIDFNDIHRHITFTTLGNDAIGGRDVRIEKSYTERLTPFRLRCLLHGLGIKCDWDTEVTFERLMELEGAEYHKETNCVYTDILSFYQYNTGGWFVLFGEFDKQPITTMKQVHLLLEAARVVK